MADIEQIRKLLESGTSAGGVTEEAIQEAEKKLDVRFPPSYRAFLSEYGNVNGTPYEIAGLSHETVNDDEPPYWWDVVSSNLQIRRAAKGCIPNEYILISGDGGDYKFYLDTSRPNAQGECPVIVLGPGADAIVIADGFFDFLNHSFAGTISF